MGSASRLLPLILVAAAVCACQSPSPRRILDRLPRQEGLVQLRGQPVTLLGRLPEVGEAAPEAVLVDRSMTERSLHDYRDGGILILSSVPSLDTPVCSRQTATFNEKAAALAPDVRILTVSMDLPMAQARWCGAHGVERVETASDYRYWDFGLAWGLRIRESGLLARAVFVVDREGRIVWRQVVPELTREPDYEAVLAAAAALGG